MISYQEYDRTLWNIISELGEVYAEPIQRGSALLEELHALHEKLFREYEQKIELLKSLSSRVIRTAGDYRFNLEWYMMNYTAQEGNLEFLRVLRAGKVYPWNEWTMAYAALGGHIEVLQALRDGSLGGICYWSHSTTLYAVEGGHLEILRALRNGSLGRVCPWNKERCRRVARKYKEIVELIDSGELD